jgi:hypothetical protein
VKADFSSQARVMTATAKCLEALNSLTGDERKRAMFGVIVHTLEENDPEHKKVIQSILEKMAAEVRR